MIVFTIPTFGSTEEMFRGEDNIKLQYAGMIIIFDFPEKEHPIEDMKLLCIQIIIIIHNRYL